MIIRLRQWEKLKLADFVDEISIFGNNLHISVNEKMKEQNQINSFISQAGAYKVSKIDEITPTLEDVFYSPLRKRKTESCLKELSQ